MGTLRLPGLLTGIDTNELISQLMALERYRLDAFEQRKSIWGQKQDALSTLESKLSNLRSSVRALSDADELRAFSTSSSDEDKVTADALTNAFEGNHTVVVNQLATSERWVHTAGLKYAEDYVSPGGTGTFIYSYNHKETSITTTATTTLEDMVGLINNDANNPGVTASLLYYGDAYHLVLNGNDAGSDYQISINSGSTEVWKSVSELTKDTDNATLSTKIIELDGFSGTRDDNDVIEITGADHFGVAISHPDFSITDYTTVGHLISEINDAFDGRAKATFENGKIILTDSTCGTSSLSVTLTYNNKGSGGSLSLPMGFTTEGNTTEASLANFAASNFTMSQVAQDSKIKVDGFPSASAASERQTVTLSAVPDYGTFTLTYQGETTTDIAYDASSSDIEDALEALSAFNTGNITVSGAIGTNPTIDFASSLGNVDLLMINSSMKNGGEFGTDVTGSIAETTAGSDGWISRSSNTVDNVIYGVALHLHDTTEANGEQITLTRDIQSVKDKLNSMITAYNSAVVFIKEKTGYNDVLKTAGVLMGDYVVSTMQYQFRRPFIAQASGFVEDIDTFLTPVNIGLTIDRDGVLNLDTSDFDDAIAEDYLGVLSIIGANKTGSSDNDTIKFYGASSNYTTAESYRVKVTYDASGNLATASIKLFSEDDTQYRSATISGNIITGNSSFDSNGNPVYPENALQLTAPATGTPSSTSYAMIRVKQGFTGAIEDVLDRMLKTTTGSMDVDQGMVADQIEEIEDRIEYEQVRLDAMEKRLITRFAVLEATLASLQNQMASLGFATA